MEKVMRWLVIGGTAESLETVEYLLSKKAEVCVSVATEMGSLMYEPYPVEVWQGRMDRKGFAERMENERITHVADVSHPFAKEVTETVRDVCKARNIPYVRYTRGDVLEHMDAKQLPKFQWAADAREAALLLSCMEGNILFTVGVQTLEVYKEWIPDFQERCYARVMDYPDSIRVCREIFQDESHWWAANPPFTPEANQEMLRSAGARIMVTKDSGMAGGLLEKMEAARREDVKVLLLERPKETDAVYCLEELDIYF